MKIAILGCGAMGSLFGAYLSKMHDVTMIDTNCSLVDAVNSSGILIREPDDSETVYYPKAAYSGAALGSVDHIDLIVLFVKSISSNAALDANKCIISPNTYIMTLQNGSGHEDTLLKYTDAAHIIIGTTQHNANISDAGVCNHGGSGATYLGSIAGGGAVNLQPFADAFTSCGLETGISQNVQKMIWDKMFTNISASALTGVLQVPLGFISSNEYAQNLCQKLIREAVTVAASLGMDFDYDAKAAEVKAVCDNSPNGQTSIYNDLKHGRKTEVDTISGSIVKAAKKHGVSVPYHTFIVDLIHAMEGKNFF